jgi:hypothetical protein
VTAAPTAGNTGNFTPVPIYAGVLRATAELLELVEEFFTTTDSARAQLGRFLAARHHDDDPDPAMEATLVLHELAEAASLLHSLGGDADPAQQDLA